MRKQVIVPDSLNEITLEQYQKYLKIQDNNDDDTFLAIKMIEIFCGIRSDLIMKMKEAWDKVPEIIPDYDNLLVNNKDELKDYLQKLDSVVVFKKQF